MLKLHSARGFVLLAGANVASANANSFRHAVGAAEFLSRAQRMPDELDRRPPPGRQAIGQRLTLAVQKRLHPQAWQDNTQPLAEADTAGEQLRRAVQARLPKRPQHKHTTAARSNNDETFAQKLARITKEKTKQRR